LYKELPKINETGQKQTLQSQAKPILNRFQTKKMPVSADSITKETHVSIFRN